MKRYSRLIVLYAISFACVAVNTWLIMTGHNRLPLLVFVVCVVGGSLILRKLPPSDISKLLQKPETRTRIAQKHMVLHSALAPQAVADTLLRSIDKEIVLHDAMPWFVRLVWKGGSRQVRGLIDGNKCRLKRRNAWQWSPNFYGQWEAEYSGTRIEGYFDLAPRVKSALRFTRVTVLSLAVIGIVLNALDLTAGTHFTVDPNIGLWISIFFIPFILGFYLLATSLGSRRDKSLLEFLEQTLAANRVR